MEGGLSERVCGVGEEGGGGGGEVVKVPKLWWVIDVEYLCAHLCVKA